MNKSILWALIFAVAFMALAAGLGAAENRGLLSEEFVNRTIQVIIGLMLAVYSNFTPKQIGAPGSPQAEAWKQRVLRVSGWSMAVAGLIYAALWAFAPYDFANYASIAVVATAMAVTMATVLRAAIACRALAAG